MMANFSQLKIVITAALLAAAVGQTAATDEPSMLPTLGPTSSRRLSPPRQRQSRRLPSRQPTGRRSPAAHVRLHLAHGGAGGKTDVIVADTDVLADGKAVGNAISAADAIASDPRRRRSPPTPRPTAKPTPKPSPAPTNRTETPTLCRCQRRRTTASAGGQPGACRRIRRTIARRRMGHRQGGTDVVQR